MIDFDKALEREYKKSRLIGWFLLGPAPVITLVVLYYVFDSPLANPAPNNMLMYILLIVAVVEPSVVPLVHRVQMSVHRVRKRDPIVDGKFFAVLNLTRYALVFAVYIHGAMVYMITLDITTMLYFYAIGAAWSIVHWPRRSHLSRFLKALNAP